MSASPRRLAAISRWTRRRRGPAEWTILIAVNLAAFAILAGPILVAGRIYHDNIRLWSVFRDSLHAVNAYGELMLWHPEYTTFGFPAFYFVHLGTNTLTPLSVILHFGAWLAGMAGVRIRDVTPIYLLYVYLVVPLLLSVSFYALARQIVRHPIARRFLIVVSAFSPGVIFNYSDNGPEQTAYGFLAAAAVLAYYRCPGPRRFLMLALAAGVLTASVNHLALYWNAIFVPLFVIVILGIGSTRARLVRAWRGVPAPAWGALALLLATYLAWPATTFAHGSTIVRSTIGARVYDARALLPGNPIEPLTASTPGIGFEWQPRPGNAEPVWAMVPYPEARFAYTYLGGLTLALAFIGLVFGRDPWRMRLAVLAVVLCAILPMTSSNPIFTMLVDLLWVLRSVNHFSDATFRNGGAFLLLLLAGLGLEAVLKYRQRRAVTVTLTAAFVVGTAAGLAILVRVYRGELVDRIGPLLAVFMAIASLYLLVLIALAASRINVRPALNAVVVVGLIDVAAVSAFHCSYVVWPLAEGPFPVPPVQALSVQEGDPRRQYADHLLTLEDRLTLVRDGVDVDRFRELPVFALYREGAVPSNNMPGVIRRFSLEYNLARVEVDAEGEQFLFWRNSDFPGWSASVRKPDAASQPAPIHRAQRLFMAVRVPDGASEVEFRFEPAWFRLLFWWTYGSLAVLAVTATGYRLQATRT